MAWPWYVLVGSVVTFVAGSIFGSNVSANHMVGMMGIGFSIGFAQSHFELGAIFGLMVLCYGFLPVYRKLKLYTLSEYLGRRYDDRSRDRNRDRSRDRFPGRRATKAFFLGNAFAASRAPAIPQATAMNNASFISQVRP